jgi:hypothetical protein
MKPSTAVALYNPLGIKVSPGDFIEIRVGDTKPKAGTPDGFITVTRVLQRADQPEGRCWWESREEKACGYAMCCVTVRPPSVFSINNFRHEGLPLTHSINLRGLPFIERDC